MNRYRKIWFFLKRKHFGFSDMKPFAQPDSSPLLTGSGCLFFSGWRNDRSSWHWPLDHVLHRPSGTPNSFHSSICIDLQMIIVWSNGYVGRCILLLRKRSSKKLHLTYTHLPRSIFHLSPPGPCIRFAFIFSCLLFSPFWKPISCPHLGHLGFLSSV